jgi:hypothetical protein
MAYVQVTIWLRGKTGENGWMLAALKILFNNFFNKIQAFLFAHGVDELAANLRVRRWFTSRLNHSGRQRRKPACRQTDRKLILKIAECHR